MRPKTIVDILSQMRHGEWFGFNGKEQVYENLTILSDDEKPTEEWIEAELKRRQDEWDAGKIAKDARLESVKTKLESLGLTTDEVKDAFGL